MGGPSCTCRGSVGGDAAGFAAVVESGLVPAPVVGDVPDAPGVPDAAGFAAVVLMAAAAAVSESWWTLSRAWRIESRMALRTRAIESRRTESRWERCLTALSWRITGGVESCGLAVDVAGGCVESDCAYSPPDIRSKRKT